MRISHIHIENRSSASSKEKGGSSCSLGLVINRTFCKHAGERDKEENGTKCFSVLLIGFGRSSVKQRGVESALKPIGSVPLLLIWSPGSGKTSDWAAVNVRDRRFGQSAPKRFYWALSKIDL